MGKANISFPDGMLEEVDKRAAATGTTRSGFIQEATARYLAEQRECAARTQREHEIRSALERMREIGRQMPPGEDGTAIIRRMRDEIPPWLEQSDVE